MNKLVLNESEATALALFINEVNDIQGQATGYVRDRLDGAMEKMPRYIGEQLFAVSEHKHFSDWVMINNVPVRIESKKGEVEQC